MGVRGLCCGFDLFGRRIQFAVTYVVSHAAPEERGLLRHNADLFAQTADPDLPDVVPVYGDASFGGIVESWDQVHQSRLARSARSDQRDDLARSRRQADLSEYLTRLIRVAVVEADVIEPHLALNGREFDRIRIVLHLRRGIQQLEDAFACPQCALELAVQPGEAGNRRGDRHGVKQEGDELARRQVARNHLAAADIEDQRDGAVGNEADHRPQRGIEPHALHRYAEQALHCLAVATDLVGLPRERLDDAHA